MAGEKAVQAAEAPAEETLPVGDAPFSTAETTEEAPAEEKPADKVTKEAEEIAADITPGEEETAAEKEPGEEQTADEVDRILKEAEAETPNVQKRIDALTAKVKALEAENAKLAKGEKAQTEEKVYTQEELAHAMMKAVEENNPALMRDVIAEIQSGVEKKLLKMYTEEKESGKKASEAIQTEWNETVESFKPYTDPKKAPLWPNSHKDLDLTSPTSLLYQVAMALYWSKDEAKATHYRGQPGGQKLAVADALTYLLRTKAGKVTDSKVQGLKTQLTKERMKKSPVSGGPGAEKKGPAKPKTGADTLAEVIAERKQFQEERL